VFMMPLSTDRKFRGIGTIYTSSKVFGQFLYIWKSKKADIEKKHNPFVRTGNKTQNKCANMSVYSWHDYRYVLYCNCISCSLIIQLIGWCFLYVLYWLL